MSAFSGLTMSGSSSSTSTMRLPEAALMDTITKIMVSIMRLMSTLNT